jgi:hypothetical protein
MDPTKKELYVAKRSSGVDTTDPAIHSAIDLLRSDQDPTNWLLLKVNGTVGGVHGYGSGGLSEFSAALSDEDILYGALRCTVAGKVKFYHVFFVGQHVGGMKKGKASLFKSSIFGLIDAHGEVACSGGLEEYSEELIVGAISRMAGSTDVVF